MRSHRKWLGLAVPAVLAALVVTVPAASSAQAAAIPHTKNAVHVVRSGLVQGCEYISNEFANGLEIKGNGVNKPVSLAAAPGNCFSRYNFFTYGKYSGWEYQNGDGHCLWNDGGVIELGAACQAGHPNEEFFGIDDAAGLGWTVGDETTGTSDVLNSTSCGSGPHVEMNSAATAGCARWNFPEAG